MAQEQKGCKCYISTLGPHSGIRFCGLHAHAGEMKEMLKRLEWVWVAKDGGRCPVCLGWQDLEFHRGHESDCELQALIAQVDGEE